VSLLELKLAVKHAEHLSSQAGTSSCNFKAHSYDRAVNFSSFFGWAGSMRASITNLTHHDVIISSVACLTAPLSVGLLLCWLILRHLVQGPHLLHLQASSRGGMEYMLLIDESASIGMCKCCRQSQGFLAAWLVHAEWHLHPANPVSHTHQRLLSIATRMIRNVWFLMA